MTRKTFLLFLVTPICIVAASLLTVVAEEKAGPRVSARAKVSDGMKVKRSDALAFAAKVLLAAETIHEAYMQEVKQEELVGWAIEGLYRGIGAEMPKDVSERITKNLGVKELEDLLAEVRERLGNREDLANHKDLDIALGQMTGHLDPDSTYIDPEKKRRAGTVSPGPLFGIGVQIKQDPQRNLLRVVTPIRGSPAYRVRPTNVEIGKTSAGLQAGDLIIQITNEVDKNGKRLESPEVLSTHGLPLSEAMKRIIGPGGALEALLDRLFAHEEGAGDFRVAEAAQGFQGQSQLVLARQPWMAAGKDHPQLAVLDLRIVKQLVEPPSVSPPRSWGEKKRGDELPPTHL